MGKLDRLSVFINVVESHSFTAAAKKLGVSTAAVSKQIHKLESETQIQLLDRTTRRLSLTEPGQIYYEQCRRLFGEIEETERLVSNLHGEPSGELRVVAARYFGEKYVVPFLKPFIQAYPKIRLELELAERMPDLFKENIDIILGVSVAGPELAMQKQIAKTRYVFCASPEYLKRNGTPKKPVDLADHAYIDHQMRRPRGVVQFARGIEVRLKPQLSLNDTASMLQCALSGMGIVQLHHYVVSDALEEKKLVEVLPGFVKSEVPIFLYYQSSRYLQPKIRKFIDFFCNKF